MYIVQYIIMFGRYFVSPGLYSHKNVDGIRHMQYAC